MINYELSKYIRIFRQYPLTSCGLPSLLDNIKRVLFYSREKYGFDLQDELEKKINSLENKQTFFYKN